MKTTQALQEARDNFSALLQDVRGVVAAGHNSGSYGELLSKHVTRCSKSIDVIDAALSEQAVQPAEQVAGFSEVIVLQAIGRGWCHPVNSQKVMDTDLAFAIRDEVMVMLSASPKHVSKPVNDAMTPEQINEVNETLWTELDELKEKTGYNDYKEAHRGLTQRTFLGYMLDLKKPAQPSADKLDAELPPNQKLLELADQVDYEQLWRRSGLEIFVMTPEQKTRLNAGVNLRRYASLLGEDRWRLHPPRAGMCYSGLSLDTVYKMAKKSEASRDAAMLATVPVQSRD